jgi:hypothetical protein
MLVPVLNHLFLFVIVTLLAVALPSAAAAQPQANGAQKRAAAVRAPDGAIRVDGRLDDAAWRDAPPETDFVQREPDEGAQPTDRMDVRFVYDDTALYVGARMYSADPIQAPLGRRDEGDQSEYFAVFLDTYLDRRTATAFGVTAAGVRLDEYFPTDSDDGDDGYTRCGWLVRPWTRRVGRRSCGFLFRSFASPTKNPKCGASTSRDGSRRATKRCTGPS